LVRRRRAVATCRRPTSRRALPVQSRDQLQGSIARAGPVCCIARTEALVYVKQARHLTSRHAGAAPSRKTPRCRASFCSSRARTISRPPLPGPARVASVVSESECQPGSAANA
jgi:hypothetical protein